MGFVFVALRPRSAQADACSCTQLSHQCLPRDAVSSSQARCLLACLACLAAEAFVVDLVAAEPAAVETEVVAPDPLPEPYTSLFKQAKEAPTDFNTWTSLISAAEKLVRLCYQSSFSMQAPNIASAAALLLV